MDIRIGELDGIEATNFLACEGHSARVLVLTTFDIDEYVYKAMKAGASGFLLKDVDPPELIHAVRIVASGDALLAPAITRRLVEEFVSGPPPGQTLPALAHSHRPRTRGVDARRSRSLEPGNRQRAVHQRRDREDAPHARSRQARRPRPLRQWCSYESGLVQPWPRRNAARPVRPSKVVPESSAVSPGSRHPGCGRRR